VRAATEDVPISARLGLRALFSVHLGLHGFSVLSVYLDKRGPELPPRLNQDADADADVEDRKDLGRGT
jgi:hypothetical protein